MSDPNSDMHPDFPIWHRSVSMGTDNVGRDRRWAGVNALARDADRDLVEALVRLAFDHEKLQPQPRALGRIHEALRKGDDAFDPRGTGRDVQVHAAACLQVLFDGGTDLGALAALSVVTAAFSDTRRPNLPIDLTARAEAALVRIADNNRRRPRITVDREPPVLDVPAALADLPDTFDAQALRAAFTSFVKAARVSLEGLTSRQAKALSAFERVLRIQDEELQVLWWLTNGRSLSLDRTFEAVPAEFQPFLFAKELSDQTTSLPGPRSIKALLMRAGLKDRKKLTVAMAVNAVDPSWLAALDGDGPSALTLPVHFAIARQMETGDAEAWVANWSAVTGIDASRQFHPSALAVQFYRECLLLAFG